MCVLKNDTHCKRLSDDAQGWLFSRSLNSFLCLSGNFIPSCYAETASYPVIHKTSLRVAFQDATSKAKSEIFGNSAVPIPSHSRGIIPILIPA